MFTWTGASILGGCFVLLLLCEQVVSRPSRFAGKQRSRTASFVFTSLVTSMLAAGCGAGLWGYSLYLTIQGTSEALSTLDTTLSGAAAGSANADVIQNPGSELKWSIGALLMTAAASTAGLTFISTFIALLFFSSFIKASSHLSFISRKTVAAGSFEVVLNRNNAAASTKGQAAPASPLLQTAGRGKTETSGRHASQSKAATADSGNFDGADDEDGNADEATRMASDFAIVKFCSLPVDAQARLLQWLLRLKSMPADQHEQAATVIRHVLAVDGSKQQRRVLVSLVRIHDRMADDKPRLNIKGNHEGMGVEGSARNSNRGNTASSLLAAVRVDGSTSSAGAADRQRLAVVPEGEFIGDGNADGDDGFAEENSVQQQQYYLDHEGDENVNHGYLYPSDDNSNNGFIGGTVYEEIVPNVAMNAQMAVQAMAGHNHEHKYRNTIDNPLSRSGSNSSGNSRSIPSHSSMINPLVMLQQQQQQGRQGRTQPLQSYSVLATANNAIAAGAADAAASATANAAGMNSNAYGQGDQGQGLPMQRSPNRGLGGQAAGQPSFEQLGGCHNGSNAGDSGVNVVDHVTGRLQPADRPFTRQEIEALVTAGYLRPAALVSAGLVSPSIALQQQQPPLRLLPSARSGSSGLGGDMAASTSPSASSPSFQQGTGQTAYEQYQLADHLRGKPWEASTGGQPLASSQANPLLLRSQGRSTSSSATAQPRQSPPNLSTVQASFSASTPPTTTTNSSGNNSAMRSPLSAYASTATTTANASGHRPSITNAIAVPRPGDRLQSAIATALGYSMTSTAQRLVAQAVASGHGSSGGGGEQMNSRRGSAHAQQAVTVAASTLPASEAPAIAAIAAAAAASAGSPSQNVIKSTTNVGTGLQRAATAKTQPVEPAWIRAASAAVAGDGYEPTVAAASESRRAGIAQAMASLPRLGTTHSRSGSLGLPGPLYFQ